MKELEIIVIGGGHAGIEAANISAKLGANTMLITSNIDNIGKMSCNPAVGGIGKSQMVMEIKEIGGIMPKITDISGINFRTINTSKGKAVRATRIQVEKNKYKKEAIKKLLKNKKLKILQQDIVDLIIEKQKIIGVKTENNIKIKSKVVILTNGTFMKCKIATGKKKINKARDNEINNDKLSKKIEFHMRGVKKFKTGTPPRIKIKSINNKILKEIKSEKPKPFFCKKIKKREFPCCWSTETNEITREIINKNIKKSSSYNGTINSKGPRYCISIEDKIKRFPNIKKHNLFLELENKITKEIYIGGLATSFNAKIQKKIIRSIKGLKNAEITRFGYAIEYSYLNPKFLKRSLENKIVENLFLAGQINGTSGYEEAAAQGIIAGINAFKKIKEDKPIILKSNNSYIGLMIKDITKYGIEEPYRMFTSRAKNRLKMREDNSKYRTYKILKKHKIITKKKYKKIKRNKKICKKFIVFSRKKKIFYENRKETIFKILINNRKNIEKIWKNRNFKKTIIRYFNYKINIKMLNYIESEIKYKGYYKKKKKNINIYKKIKIENIKNISKETKEKLKESNFFTLKDIKKNINIRSACLENIENYLKKKPSK